MSPFAWIEKWFGPPPRRILGEFLTLLAQRDRRNTEDFLGLTSTAAASARKPRILRGIPACRRASHAQRSPVMQKRSPRPREFERMSLHHNGLQQKPVALNEECRN